MLYLNSDEKGKGYGAHFIQKAKLVFKEKGYTKMVIGCLSGNPSNNFYVHMGGEFVRQDPWDVFDEHYMENVYEYDLTK